MTLQRTRLQTSHARRAAVLLGCLLAALPLRAQTIDAPPPQLSELAPQPAPTPLLASTTRAAAEPMAAAAIEPAASEAVSASVRLTELPLLLQLPATVPTRLPPPRKARAAGAAASAVEAEPPQAAASADPAVALSLPAAMGLGLANNLDVRAAQFRAESFAQTRNAARGALLPRVELRLGAGRGRLESVDPYEARRRLDKTATLTQALLDEPSRREWQRQGVLADSALTQLDGTQSSSGLEVAAAYLQALQSRLVIDLNIEYDGLLGELLRYITDRAAGGGASNADRDRVRARVANTRAALSDANANFIIALRNLERLLGETPAALLVAAPEGLAIPAELDGAKELALRQNHDLLAARAEIAAGNFERLGYASRFTPRVDLEVSQGRNTNAAGADSYLRDTKVMVVVTVPLLNGGTDVAQYRAAVARREEQRARADNIERKLVQDLDAAYANLSAAVERDRAVREELQSNRAVVAAFKEQLTGANRSLLDVLDAYQRLYQSKLDLTTLVVNETQTQLRVAHLTGTLLPTLLPTGPAE